MNSAQKIVSKLLEGENVEYYFTTRHFGFSKAPFKSLNFAYHVGDEKKDVLKNHRLLASHLEYDFTNLVYMNQIHSNRVVRVNSKLASPITCDALITKELETPLMVMSADCTPILLYDKESRTIAAVHAGRAGAFTNVVANTLQEMNSNRENIIAILGPSIHQCCYEVSKEIAKEAKELDYSFSIKEYHSKFYLDVNSILLHQLKSEGIKEENIELLNYCTACEVEHFFSYRKEGRTGRMAAVICLKE